jgi:hypothetical protein
MAVGLPVGQQQADALLPGGPQALRRRGAAGVTVGAREQAARPPAE